MKKGTIGKAISVKDLVDLMKKNIKDNKVVNVIIKQGEKK